MFSIQDEKPSLFSSFAASASYSVTGDSISMQAFFPLYCTTCMKPFSSKKDYQGHMNSRHYGVKPYVCNKCGKGFAYIQSMQRHFRMSKMCAKDSCESGNM